MMAARATDLELQKAASGIYNTPSILCTVSVLYKEWSYLLQLYTFVVDSVSNINISSELGTSRNSDFVSLHSCRGSGLGDL